MVSEKCKNKWGEFEIMIDADVFTFNCLEEYIEKYKNGPMVAYANIKKLINRAQFSDFADAILAEVDCQGRCEMSSDYKTTVIAFLSKEKPIFNGQ